MSPQELKDLREKAGLTINQCEKMMGFDSGKIFAWEQDPKSIMHMKPMPKHLNKYIDKIEGILEKKRDKSMTITSMNKKQLIDFIASNVDIKERRFVNFIDKCRDAVFSDKDFNRDTLLYLARNIQPCGRCCF